ncbi:HAD-IA family hydrolase [Corynebacterium nuruki]|uniref:HAD-IA family hydrolase n=1 Tax=Corynebacterium nuruki TaxID=1032851 RepID=UPI0002485A4C|nr:HAD-IA family hydrolase [Corynebacterium nuruki]
MPSAPLTCRALLFDMDGTLVDSTVAVETIWTRAAEAHGLDPAEVIAYSHGRQTADTVDHFLPDLSGDGRRRITGELRQQEEQWPGRIDEIPGAADLMRQVLAAGMPAALVTSATRDLARARMAAAGVPLPGVLVTAEDVDHGKPAPDGYLLAAHRLGVDPADCLGFEDAPNGIAAARAAGTQLLVVGRDIPDLTTVRVGGDGHGTVNV